MAEKSIKLVKNGEKCNDIPFSLRLRGRENSSVVATQNAGRFGRLEARPLPKRANVALVAMSGRLSLDSRLEDLESTQDQRTSGKNSGK